MPTDNAREVNVTINADGEVKDAEDPGLSDPWHRPWIDAHFPKTGRVYGWDISSYLSGGRIRRPRYAGSVAAAASEPTDASDRQTLQVRPTYFVKLDVGYWGHYYRQQSQTTIPLPQRNFGLIEGRNVWLCNYRGSSTFTNPSSLRPAAGTLVDRLLQRLDSHGLHIELKSFATIPENPDAAVPVGTKLYVCFPDLHLPEQWPDLAPVGNRLPAGRERAALRRLLWLCQCRPGPAADNLLNQSHLDTVQACLDSWAAGSTGRLRITFPASVCITVEVVGDTAVTNVTHNAIALDCSKDQVLAEKAYLDREIQAKSTWFYPAAYAGTRHRQPITTSPDEADPPEDETADDPIGVTGASHMPSPAADLANFLFVVRELRNAEGADNVKVVQVGDLYELWMNREFMYRESPVIAADQLGDRGTLTGVSVRAALLSTDMTFPTAFQYRHDRDWVEGGTVHTAKRYVYHGWNRDLLLRRHDVAGANPGAARMGRLLADRIAAVEDWSYADPTTDPLLPQLRQWVNGRRAAFTRANACGFTETRWNKIVLELFGSELSAVRIHGNHDGYRSDSALLTNRGSPAASTQWFSEPGVWVEHGHRWDYFNRDGVSMGAGMTNVVYYHNEALIAASGGSMAAVLQQEQGFFQTGSAQWFLLVNYGNPSWWGSGVERFGVFVSGHTHGPDLVKIHFKLATADRIADSARQRQEDLDRMQRRVRQAASDAADRAAQMARDAAAGARRRMGELSQRASDLWREWSPF